MGGGTIPHRDLFATYLNYVYTSTLATSELSKDQISKLNQTQFTQHIGKEYLSLAVLYVLGERLQDTKFKNLIVDTIVGLASMISPAKTWIAPDRAMITIIYEGTPESSQARRLIADLSTGYTLDSMKSFLGFRLEDYPRHFLRDLVIAVRKEASIKINPAKRDGPSAYYETTKDAQDATPLLNCGPSNGVPEKS
ncbi:hypothetical protein CC80DRAFT_496899 [Byssothecium circinans]|uniref:BTB domain-containing protein n=1 Tax=Byssothecium circinans TaxID=147558 RepID=A0A6A5TDB6_9PLEO|nr:hypothetical protein CC80DRAFT_496899 [Byssothecium circinans]